MQRFLDRRQGVKGMQLKQVDEISLKPFEAGIDRLDQPIARGYRLIGALTHREGGFG